MTWTSFDHDLDQGFFVIEQIHLEIPDLFG